MSSLWRNSVELHNPMKSDDLQNHHLFSFFILFLVAKKVRNGTGIDLTDQIDSLALRLYESSRWSVRIMCLPSPLR